MRKHLALFLFALSACASAPELARPPAEPVKAVAPDGPVKVGLGCAGGAPVPILWNPSSTPRRCHLGEDGPFEVEGLRFKTLDDVWPSPGSAPQCEDAPLDVASEVAEKIARLEAPEPSVREKAAQAIAEFGHRATFAVPALAARARAEVEDGPLYHAGRALIDLLGADAVPLLVDAIGARIDASGRRQLVELIVGLGEVAASGLGPRVLEPRVAEAFKTAEVMKVHPEAGRRLMLARLDASRQPDARALAIYLERRPDDEEVARVAIEALHAASDPMERYRLIAPLTHLRSSAAVGALVSALGDPDRRVVRKAAQALGLLAQAAPALASTEMANAVAALIPSEDESLLWQATMALGRIGRDTPRVRAALAAASATTDPRIRIIAAAARTQVGRERFGTSAMGRIPAESGANDELTLREGVASDDSRVRGLALARALELGPLAAPLVDAIAARLDEAGAELWVADGLAEILLAIGPAAHAAMRGIAVGRPRVMLATWLEVVSAVGEEVAAPIGERLGGLVCTPLPRDVVYHGVEAAVVRLRLGDGRAIDRAKLVEYLSATSSATLARTLTPHVLNLGLGEMERTAIAWLAEHHVALDARRALGRLWAELRRGDASATSLLSPTPSHRARQRLDLEVLER